MRVRLSIFALMTSVTALSANEFYIAQAADTLQCALVNVPPATTAHTLLDEGKVFFDEREARDVMLKLSECVKRGPAPASESRQGR